jgi:hypothetical protein
MKKLFFATLFFVSSSIVIAQVELPQPSPKSFFKQTVGLTEVSIEYSSPAVKGRSVWGELVPYNELWRTGANMATKLTFSREVNIAGTKVPAGSYSLLTIPGRDEFTVILNKDAELRGTSGYKAENDVVNTKVKTEFIPHRERLLIIVSDFTDESAAITLEWEKVRLSLPFSVNTAEHASKNIQAMNNASWRNYANSAKYLFDAKDYEQALKMINQSLALNSEQWYSHWIKAQVLAARNQWKDANLAVLKAKELGDKSENFFYKADVDRALAEWKGKK